MLAKLSTPFGVGKPVRVRWMFVAVREPLPENLLDALLAGHEAEQPAPGSRRVVGVPASQHGDFHRLLIVALAIEQADDAGGEV